MIEIFDRKNGANPSPYKGGVRGGQKIRTRNFSLGENRNEIFDGKNKKIVRCGGVKIQRTCEFLCKRGYFKFV